MSITEWKKDKGVEYPFKGILLVMNNKLSQGGKQRIQATNFALLITTLFDLKKLTNFDLFFNPNVLVTPILIFFSPPTQSLSSSLYFSLFLSLNLHIP